MKRTLSCLVGALAIVVACGGAKATSLDDMDGGVSDGGAADAANDGAPRPRFEDLVTCSAPGQCVLGAKGCCGLGCQPDDQLVAFRRGEDQDVIAATCDQTGPVACPKCARQLPGYLQAFCTAGTCAVTDLRKDAISACTRDEDCVLRYGTCCQPCDGGSIESLVAIRSGAEGELERQICAGTEACDKCLPAFPDGARARCNPTSKHCEIQ